MGRGRGAGLLEGHAEEVGAGENEMMVCGMSLGYADESAVVNSFQTSRVPAESFTHWLE